MATKRNSTDPYVQFAGVYDQEAHTRVANGFFRRLRPLLGRVNSRPVFDLGCGTGLLSEKIAMAGYPVVGVDLSPAMIKLARKRCERFGATVKFLCKDMEELPINSGAMVAASCGEVVNHVPTAVSLNRIFSKVRTCLALGGIFAFDALNRTGFERYWDGHTYLDETPSGDLVMECEWNPARRRGTAYILSYRKLTSGRFTKNTSWLTEYLHEDSVLEQQLRNAGFSDVAKLTWSPWEANSSDRPLERTFWVAKS